MAVSGVVEVMLASGGESAGRESGVTVGDVVADRLPIDAGEPYLLLREISP